MAELINAAGPWLGWFIAGGLLAWRVYAYQTGRAISPTQHADVKERLAEMAADRDFWRDYVTENLLGALDESTEKTP